MKHKEQGPSGTKVNSEKLLRKISFLFIRFFSINGSYSHF
jgi:hypothetical protein